MAKKKRVPLTIENPIIQYAKERKWRVIVMESWTPEGADYTVHRLVFLKKHLPTIKATFKDDKLLTAYQQYRGRAVNPSAPIDPTAQTVRRWLKARAN